MEKRVNKREIVILQADKGKRMVVMNTDMYLRMAEEHIVPGDEVDEKTLRKSQHLLTATAKGLAGVLGVGSSQSARNATRCYDNVVSHAEDAATLKLLPKVHKVTREQGHPQSQPLVTASSGMSSRAGDLIADLLEPIVYLTTPRMEDRSTEEVVAQLQEAEVMIRVERESRAMAASLDVKALYPSLDQEESARIVGEFVERSVVDVSGVDWEAAQIMVASNWTEERVKLEGVRALLPVRRWKFGARPGPTTDEVTVKKNRWTGDDVEVVLEDTEEHSQT